MVEIFNESKDVVMSIESLSREGENLVIEGRLMGAWKSKMYFPAKQFPGMLKLLANSSVISFILLLPYLLLHGPSEAPEKEVRRLSNRDGRRGRFV